MLKIESRFCLLLLFLSDFKSDLISRVLSEYLAALPVKTRCAQGGGTELGPNASL